MFLKPCLKLLSMGNVKYIISQCFKRPLLPRIPPIKIFRAITEIRVCEPAPIDGNVEVDELALICAFIQEIEPERIFEFGTFDGRTTLNMAVASPDNALVYILEIKSVQCSGNPRPTSVIMPDNEALSIP